MTDDTRLLAHRDDPDTSHIAAEAATNRDVLKRAIRTMIAEYGSQTAFELRHRYFAERESRGWPMVQPHSVDRRLSELHRDGVVSDSGDRRMSPYNRPAVVWSEVRMSDVVPTPVEDCAHMVCIRVNGAWMCANCQTTIADDIAGF